MVVVLVIALPASAKTSPAPLEEGAGDLECIGVVNMTAILFGFISTP